MANFSSGSNKKGGLFAGVLVGILMVIIGTVLLWRNEGNNDNIINILNNLRKIIQ